MLKKLYKYRHLFFIIYVAITVGLIYKLFFGIGHKIQPPLKKIYHLQLTQENYGKKVDILAKQFNLPSAYLKSLIVLECSGRKKIPQRFEKHVFIKLKHVRNRKIKNYGSITYSKLKGKSDKELRELASSWGPFQLMGYQCFDMKNVKVSDIRGEKALYWGIFWINQRYGNYLRKKKYKDAFHIHNTGKPYPLLGKPTTHDPKYVENGVLYIDYFESN